MGKGIKSKTECTCCQDIKRGNKHTDLYCPYYKEKNENIKIIIKKEIE